MLDSSSRTIGSQVLRAFALTLSAIILHLILLFVLSLFGLLGVVVIAYDVFLFALLAFWLVIRKKSRTSSFIQSFLVMQLILGVAIAVILNTTYLVPGLDFGLYIAGCWAREEILQIAGSCA